MVRVLLVNENPNFRKTLEMLLSDVPALIALAGFVSFYACRDSSCDGP